MGVNISGATSEWEVRRTPKERRIITQYKADGYLFKEEWTVTEIIRDYVKVGHSSDSNMLEHAKMDISGIPTYDDGVITGGLTVDVYPPWSQGQTELPDEAAEFLMGWEIEFHDDGHCEAQIKTRELDVSLNKERSFKPQKLNRSPK